MLTINRSPQRCLILSNDTPSIQSLKTVFENRGDPVDCFNDRKSALRCFLQYRHDLFCMDAEFLPRHPHRLLQLFKMAHRTPGMIIFNQRGKNIAAFKYIKDSIIEIVEAPFDIVAIQNVLTTVVERLKTRTRSLFIRDLLIQVGVAIPVLILLIYLLLKK